ncbi:hypothetical protein HG530_012773 [Fusarium avenaceum]|nr:hypothetical protein HG530_012773 [Fusarium avenaceum]
MADAGRFMTKWEMVGGTGTRTGSGGGAAELLGCLGGLITAQSPRFDASRTRSADVTITLWVLVVGPDEDALLTSWNSKGSDTSHDICHNLTRLEEACDSLVLGVELAVPVYFGVVEFEDTAGLAYLNVQIIRTPEDFVGKSSELVLRANVVDLVDDGLDVRVLVKEDLGDDVFVGQLLDDEEHTNMSHCVEATWDLLVEFFREDRFHDIHFILLITDLDIVWHNSDITNFGGFLKDGTPCLRSYKLAYQLYLRSQNDTLLALRGK